MGDVFPSFVVRQWRCGCADQFGAQMRQRLRVLTLQKPNQPLPNVTPKIPRVAGVAGTHQRAQLDGTFRCVGDLKSPDLAIP